MTIASLSLLLFTSVIYDRAINYKHRQEEDTYSVLAEQFVRLSVENKTTKDINTTLAENINIKNQPAGFFAILDNNRDATFVYEKQTAKADVFNHIHPFIKEKNNLIEGQVKHNGILYFWLIRVLPGYTDKNNALLMVYPLSASVVTEVLEFFGLPFYISGFLLLWLMVWASIILSSLVTKLQKQKQVLSDQSADIEKARDEALHANQAKSHFLANMSHEIRTPLTSIIGFAESSLDIHQSMKERSKATKTIIRSSKHLMHLINEILDLSKIEAGKFEMETMPVSILEVLEEVNQIVSITAEEKGLTFGINYSYPLPEKIISDQLRLTQILLNLCSNAIKFTNKGHVYLNVSYKPDSSSLIFEVIDTGIGMSAEQMEKIFKPFEQADTTTTRKFGGTGLGLTLSKQLSEMLNGELTVESSINKGSHFFVKFEIIEIENSSYIYSNTYKNMPEKLSQANIEIPKLKGKVLLAEDNRDIQDLVKLLFKKVGIELDVVDNGKMAVKNVIESDYDLVFMDIQMPVMDGITAMKQLKRRDYNKPIIAMTANAMKKDRDECNAAGFSGFISKPINRNELYLTLMQYLKPNKTFESNKTMLTSELLSDDPDLIDLIDKFMARLPTMQDAINLAHTDKKEEELSGLIHQMKGVGGGYGYPALTELCAKIEFQIESQDPENVSQLIHEFNLIVKEILAGRDENHKIAELAQSL